METTSTRFAGEHLPRRALQARSLTGPNADSASSSSPSGALSEILEGAPGAGASSFADALRGIRRQVDCKQAALAFEIGCTDAALSHWESGARLPTPRSLSRIISALVQSGVSTGDLLELRGAWRLEQLRRWKSRTPSL
jgi:DNA-binding transcriptional regulator YiaG